MTSTASPASTAARDHLGWARQEVVDLLAGLANAQAHPSAHDEAARAVAQQIHHLWRVSGDDDIRLALLFQLGAALSGAFELIGALSPEQHAVAVSGAITRHLGASSAAA